MSEELEAVRRALVPYEHRLGITGLVPDALASVLVSSLEPVIRRRLSAELEAEHLERRRELESWARALEVGLQAQCAAVAARRARQGELEEALRAVQSELEGVRGERDRYRGALALVADGRPAQRIAWEALGRVRP